MNKKIIGLLIFLILVLIFGAYQYGSYQYEKGLNEGIESTLYNLVEGVVSQGFKEEIKCNTITFTNLNNISRKFIDVDCIQNGR